MPRIVTDQAPSAKPVSVSVDITTEWQTMIDVPDYDVPVVGFGSARRIAPGVAEISSPLLVVNYDTDSPTFNENIDVRIVRGTRPLKTGLTRADFDGFFDGGQGHVQNERIELANGAIIEVTQISSDGVDSVVDFVVLSIGDPVQAVPEPLEQNFGTLPEDQNPSPGIGFSLIVREENLSETDEHYYLMRDFPIRPFDMFRMTLSGQFLLTRDKLQIRGSSDNKMTATISYTEGQAEEDDIIGA